MLRSIIFNFVFYPVLVVYLIIMSPIVYCSGRQTAFKLAYRPVTKWLLFCLKTFARINFEVKNKENLPEGQVIIGCNHQSAWETFAFSVILDNFVPVVKKELMTKPIAGLFIRKLESIPVDRESPVKAIKTLLKHSKIAHQKGHSILIFPNGTRASADETVEYKSGIFALYKSLNIPVVPVYVNSGLFWSRNSFKKFPGTITLDFKQPIMPGLPKDEFFAQFENSLK